MKNVRERNLTEWAIVAMLVALIALLFLALAYLEPVVKGAEPPVRVRMPADLVDQVDRIGGETEFVEWWARNPQSLSPLIECIADPVVSVGQRQRLWQGLQKLQMWWPKFVAALDPNECVQPVWIGPVPFDHDPNAIVGLLIDCHQVTAGKFNRTAEACDPDGDPFTIEVLSGPPGVGVTHDVAAGTWTLAGELGPGVHAIVVRAIDAPLYGDPIATVVTILIEATPPNRAPVLY